MKQGKRSFVDRLSFRTSLGHGEGHNSREKLGVTTKGPNMIVTDLCVMRPDPETKEFQVVSIHPGVARDEIVEATGWRVKFADTVEETPPPSARELEVLRALNARTAAAHGDQA